MRTTDLDGNGAYVVSDPVTKKWAKGTGGPAGDEVQNLYPSNGVRRLTPLETERLQGFPDGWSCLCGCDPYSTAACTCPDSPRYAAMGDAVTVNVAEWIGRRIVLDAYRRLTEGGSA